MIAGFPGRAELSAAPPQRAHTSARQTFYGPAGVEDNRDRRRATFSRTRLPQIAADIALWLGYTFRPIRRAGHLLILLEVEEV